MIRVSICDILAGGEHVERELGFRPLEQDRRQRHLQQRQGSNIHIFTIQICKPGFLTVKNIIFRVKVK